jgi:CubicO group peptidase (beta-lactamase class C family)
VTTELPATIRAVLEAAIAAHVTPGGVVEVGTTSGPRWTAGAGAHTYAADATAVTLDTVYDLASLTKVIATTTLAMRAHLTRALPLDTSVATRCVAFARHPAFTVGDLLEHAAGFPAHRPFYLSVAGRAAYLARIAAEPLAYAPRTGHEYTDLGIILLGLLLEDAAAAPLDAQFDAFVAATLAGAEIAFGPRASWTGRVAPTGFDPWRGRVMAGHVHDGNAAALGGVAGHAGLFATAPAVGTFARWLLRLWRGGAPASFGITPEMVAHVTARGTVPGSSRALGWDTMLPTSSCGTRMSPTAFGHTGFTGTSLWIDPVRGLYVVLLTNRVHGANDAEGIRALRIGLHDAVITAWDAALA